MMSNEIRMIYANYRHAMLRLQVALKMSLMRMVSALMRLYIDLKFVLNWQ